MQNPARQIPAGYEVSGWYQLGTSGRALFLEEILVVSPDYFIDGTVNYEDSREPLLTHRTSGNYQTLRGEDIPWENLSTDMGTIYAAGGNNYGFWFVAAAGVLLLLGVS